MKLVGLNVCRIINFAPLYSPKGRHTVVAAAERRDTLSVVVRNDQTRCDWMNYDSVPNSYLQLRLNELITALPLRCIRE